MLMQEHAHTVFGDCVLRLKRSVSNTAELVRREVSAAIPLKQTSDRLEDDATARQVEDDQTIKGMSVGDRIRSNC